VEKVFYVLDENEARLQVAYQPEEFFKESISRIIQG
jgi:hypothetical protein